VIHPGTDARDIERAPATFDPETHGIDFFETLEGMLVQVDDAIAVGPTTSDAEITVVGDRGEHATGMTARGGIIVSPDDFNPERIHLAARLVDEMPDVHVGDLATGPIVGVMDYTNANYKVQVTSPPVFVSGGIERRSGPPRRRRASSPSRASTSRTSARPAASCSSTGSPTRSSTTSARPTCSTSSRSRTTPVRSTTAWSTRRRPTSS
jgi:hypothetical protein